MKYLLLLSILFLIGCSSSYRPPIVGPRDRLLLIDCATPKQPEKIAEMIMEKMK